MRRASCIGIMVVVTLAGIGCENTEPTADDRAAVEEVLHGYLAALAASYSSLDVEPLEQWATGSEIAAVHKTLRGLVGTGDRVDATLTGLEIESLEIFREVNATATLLEVWDVARFDAFNGREKGRNPSSVQNTIIQLRLMEGSWKVTARRVLDDPAARSRWNVATPVPQGEEGSR